MTDQKLIPFPEIFKTLSSILIEKGFSIEKAENCAMLFAQASLDGVPSHGLNRFPIFLEMIKEGVVKPESDPELIQKSLMYEQWDGQLGPGPLNAQFAMYRAIQMSKEFGMGLVGLKNTNHWMRAGNYGLLATEAGCIGICFTNTKPNLPAWGGSEPKLGNNPLVVAIPRKEGPILLDMAMSQFSYGKLNIFKNSGKKMPFEAGFDKQGNLTKDPSEIIENELALPIGLWKGAAFSLVLDIVASLLSGGNAVHQIGKAGGEFAVSQVFISLNMEKLGITEMSDTQLEGILEDFHSSQVLEGQKVRFPGENLLKTRKQNMEMGVPVDKLIWEKILAHADLDE
ncbi:3-dehydro-L-gulonate 2-dehydrogenase [Indibacter alkaliphilus LW1]|uniref:3-dehydro-L-gulonate 2-dehydrogenase n=1 Tax=Indibacter alkaliphilus (strain CCUG 57479 / KCTC 22604 / LW1) TaxID=1189612 RepID=S2D9F4_INDAL|nr:3-dehydro-L-gulonate 2-dehydrogenase [Indibacter alkaliphilus]EOZ93615.1 3-dehydro-L-gulonate 2-dehydrogenase [Indibacter alkaliphilus LW1]